ncbi:2-polyprenyl-6-methoxyphenol hydroxylase-like FAD-dependent oxidoreductase [Haloactinomyces albus]|uniref:2-polyprenyl-6-methoxyphenol hydroxylase-like FAD-dependent oxidoreductase n=1 Tax=Haloactinomyces albus TaxID=1352928 RepID=A0AAE4CM46_9ACTN|nr:FAD-dependent monooxygenase [Haloactinomyces albus]MDR7302935.1 2-polyprenyl-6-methoxyphenol hydroxylase-like FAD-dependent oxidoreductase [Haloactinomyces albus]
MRKRGLVVGLGVAGMSAAIGLRQAGWTPVIVERAPQRRTGGYFVGLMPEGKRAAVDLGIAEYLHTRNPPEGGKAWSLTRRGNRVPGVGFLHQRGDPAAVVRGDIEAALWRSTCGDAAGEPIDVRFATTPVEIDDTGSDVRVLFEEAGTGAQYREHFDLVVGADGLRSRVRRMVFGPHEDYMTKWDAMVCVFPLQDQVPSFAATDSIISARAGRAVWVFGFADRPPTVLLTYRTEDTRRESTGSTAQRLRTVFSEMDDPAVRHTLAALEETPDYLFDSVHQVKMPRWSHGRVALSGDAAWCPNLYSGMGATAALQGGAELGRALLQSPDDPRYRPDHLGSTVAPAHQEAPASRTVEAADVRAVEPSRRGTSLGDPAPRVHSARAKVGEGPCQNMGMELNRENSKPGMCAE